MSFPDLAAKMGELEAAGVEITMPLRDIPGLFRIGFVEDPWGTRIEVVEDPEHLGFHHVHLRSADPDAAMQWYQAGISDLLAPDGTFIHPRAAERTKFCSAHNRAAPEAVI